MDKVSACSENGGFSQQGGWRGGFSQQGGWRGVAPEGLKPGGF